MTSLLVLTPLAITLICCLGACFFMFKRKSLAQSLCVQEAVKLQDELGGSLTKLLKLNPQARALRKQRQVVDRSVKLAMKTGDPRLIAAAKAAQLAVILAQGALRSRQQALLTAARQARTRRHRELRGRLNSVAVYRLDSRRYFHDALAVIPVPPDSASPDYELARPFGILQQQRFQFTLDLTPPFYLPVEWKVTSLKQKYECAATLKAKEDKRWSVQILAASASSR